MSITHHSSNIGKLKNRKINIYSHGNFAAVVGNDCCCSGLVIEDCGTTDDKHAEALF